jgi:dienelactone hydrolase
MPAIRICSLSLLATIQLVAADQLSFDYDRAQPLDIQETGAHQQDGVAFREISYALGDRRNAATIIEPRPGGSAPKAAVLFVHWYGPPEPTSNRTEFIPDAVALAKAGAVSLLIDTPWSRPEYFHDRSRDGDYARSVQQVKDLRRALDVLLSQRSVDPARVAYVGHDFGAMYGALAMAADQRVQAFVFMAGTRSFSDWFLYGKPKLEGEDRQRFVDQLEPLDPIKYLPKLKMPLLLQFAENDEHVSKERADALAAAALEPKTVRRYAAGHELNDEARRDRIDWLKTQLKLDGE